MDFNALLKNYIFPVATLAGSIIGVGFFALPYIALQSGIWLTLFYFVAVASMVIFTHLLFCEISLKTPDFKRFPGFVEYYLGKKVKFIPLFSAIFGGFGVLLIYLMIGGQFLAEALSPTFGGNNLAYTLIYFFAGAGAIYFGTKVVSKFELGALVALFVSFLIIFLRGLPYFNLNNIFVSNFVFRTSNLFLPYGAIMFSLWGMGMIPEIEEMLGKNKKNIKKVIITSLLTAVVFYVCFIFLVLGITGKTTTEASLLGLKNFFSGPAILAVLLIAVFTTFNGFMALGLTLKKVLIYDLKIKPMHAFIIICAVPLILFLLGINSFIPVISFVGGVFLGIDGILVLLMYKKINKKTWIIYPLSLVFLAGIIYEIIYFIK